MKAAARRYAVNPDRFRDAVWSNGRLLQKAGDIDISYSADRIGMGRSIATPFLFRDRAWVCVGLYGEGRDRRAVAYQLVLPEVLGEECIEYETRAQGAHGDAPHQLGYYHGVLVRHQGRAFALAGPPAVFMPSDRHQQELFGQAVGSKSR